MWTPEIVIINHLHVNDCSDFRNRNWYKKTSDQHKCMWDNLSVQLHYELCNCFSHNYTERFCSLLSTLSILDLTFTCLVSRYSRSQEYKSGCEINIAFQAFLHFLRQGHINLISCLNYKLVFNRQYLLSTRYYHSLI